MPTYRVTIEGSDSALTELVVMAMQRGLKIHMETPDAKLPLKEAPRLSGAGGGSTPPRTDIEAKI